MQLIMNNNPRRPISRNRLNSSTKFVQHRDSPIASTRADRRQGTSKEDPREARIQDRELPVLALRSSPKNRFDRSHQLPFYGSLNLALHNPIFCGIHGDPPRTRLSGGDDSAAKLRDRSVAILSGIPDFED
jgi:hypothetical protein